MRARTGPTQERVTRIGDTAQCMVGAVTGGLAGRKRRHTDGTVTNMEVSVMNKLARFSASALSCGVLLLGGSAVAMAAPAVGASVAGSKVVASQRVNSTIYTIKPTGTVALDGVHTFQITGGFIEPGGWGVIDLSENGSPLPTSLSVTSVTPTAFTSDVLIGSGRCPVFEGTGTLHGSGNLVYSGTIKGTEGTDSPGSIQVTGLTLHRSY